MLQAEHQLETETNRANLAEGEVWTLEIANSDLVDRNNRLLRDLARGMEARSGLEQENRELRQKRSELEQENREMRQKHSDLEKKFTMTVASNKKFLQDEKKEWQDKKKKDEADHKHQIDLKDRQIEELKKDFNNFKDYMQKKLDAEEKKVKLEREEKVGLQGLRETSDKMRIIMSAFALRECSNLLDCSSTQDRYMGLCKSFEAMFSKAGVLLIYFVLFRKIVA
ncbi:unnamed protein product [Symbiodinium sp. CCMP2592]|nr:unnamed protein product [Symbiodinium sp. CCMP2592]